MSSRRVVVVHRGARDRYEVAAALAEAGLLERLVTDLYLPRSERRSHPGVSATNVRQTPLLGLTSFLLEKVSALPFALRRSAVRATDAHLGRTAGRLAARTGSLLLSYSYYGYEAFRNYRGPGVLFQLHPHPLSVRRILEEERRGNPQYARSLEKEWELALPDRDFARLVEETRLAKWFFTASSFTRQTLIENGASPDAISVTPYGVDLTRFTPAGRGDRTGPLRLLFVGTVAQRKGIGYLLEALRLLGNAPFELTVCGRMPDDLPLLDTFSERVKMRHFVSAAELPAVYRGADLFVLPSLAEGFGHVLLEALASGLPVLSTTSTAAPDLIEQGSEGFVVAPRRSDLLAERIDWAIAHRGQLAAMKDAARARAEKFTWQSFREKIVASIERIIKSA